MKILTVLFTLFSLSTFAADLDATKFSQFAGKRGTGKSTVDGKGLVLSSCSVSVDLSDVASFELSDPELYFSAIEVLSKFSFKKMENGISTYETAKFKGSAKGGILCGDFYNLTSKKTTLKLGMNSISVTIDYSCGMSSIFSKSHVSVVTCKFE